MNRFLKLGPNIINSLLNIRMDKAIYKLNRVFNDITEYNLILKKKEEIINKELLLLNAKNAFTEQQLETENTESALVALKKDFELQKELNNIDLMSKLYSKQLLLAQTLTQSKQNMQSKWKLFESEQHDYFNLQRQLMQEENIYIYKVRRLSLFYNWIFISVHLFIFVIVQWNEQRKRLDIINEFRTVKTSMIEMYSKSIHEMDMKSMHFVPPNHDGNLGFWKGFSMGTASALIIFVMKSIVSA